MMIAVDRHHSSAAKHAVRQGEADLAGRAIGAVHGE